MTDAVCATEPHRLGSSARISTAVICAGAHSSSVRQSSKNSHSRRIAARRLRLSHLIGKGAWLVARARKIDCERFVSKRLSSPYRAGASRNWIKTKVSETATFTIIGYEQPAPGVRGGSLDSTALRFL